jgi:Tfp pilus assembly protein PilO
MNKSAKSKKEHIVLVALGTVVVIALLWFLLLNGQTKTLAGIQKKTAEVREKVNKAEAVLKRAGEIEEELEIKAAELAGIEETMSWGDKYSQTLNTLNRFIRNHVVTFNTSDLSREVVGDVKLIPKFPYQAATFVVKVTAHYHDFGVFLADFENSFPYVRVQNIDIAPVQTPGARETEKLDCKFEIVMLVKPGSP